MVWYSNDFLNLKQPDRSKMAATNLNVKTMGSQTYSEFGICPSYGCSKSQPFSNQTVLGHRYLSPHCNLIPCILLNLLKKTFNISINLLVTNSTIFFLNRNWHGLFHHSTAPRRSLSRPDHRLLLPTRRRPLHARYLFLPTEFCVFLIIDRVPYLNI